MTIQELINKLQNSIFENKEEYIQFVKDSFRNVHDENTYWDLDYSNFDKEKNNWKLAINVFADLGENENA